MFKVRELKFHDIYLSVPYQGQQINCVLTTGIKAYMSSFPAYLGIGQTQDICLLDFLKRWLKKGIVY